MTTAPTPILLTLQRQRPDTTATPGVLTVTGAGKVLTTLRTLEHPWRGNQRQVSRIPAGTYQCTPHGWAPDAPVKFKRVWEVQGVTGRDAILLHAGNTTKDTSGCILVGTGHSGAAMITESRRAIDLLRTLIGPRPFTLVVKDPA